MSSINEVDFKIDYSFKFLFNFVFLCICLFCVNAYWCSYMRSDYDGQDMVLISLEWMRQFLSFVLLFERGPRYISQATIQLSSLRFSSSVIRD